MLPRRRMSGRAIRPIGTRIPESSNPDSGMSSELIHGNDECQWTVARARNQKTTVRQRATSGSDCSSVDCGVLGWDALRSAQAGHCLVLLYCVPHLFHNGGSASHDSEIEARRESFSGDLRACLLLFLVRGSHLDVIDEPGPTGLLTAGP